MYVAFFNAGCQDSQVILALENNRAGFVRSERQNGASVFAASSPNGGSGTTSWVGFSSRRRAWAMEGSFKDDGPPVDLFDGVRNAGLLFLDLGCEALASLSAANALHGIDRSRIFAYDGVHAAILVTEGRRRIFCQQVSCGLYDLGVSINPRSDWRDALSATVTSLIVGSTESIANGVRCGLNSRSERFSSQSWSSVVHMAPSRVAVHQRCADGATEGLSVHYFRTMVEDDHLGLPPIHDRQDNVQDAFVIFGTHSHHPVRFGQHVGALGHGRSRPSKPQARVAYESATAPKRHKKDPNRPRGYISAFNFFVKDKRPTYVQSRPNAQGHSLEHNNEINKMLGKVWKTATEQEKKTYEEKATADKVRYLKEMSAYRPPEGYERIAPRINVPKGFSAVSWDPDVIAGTTAQPCRRPWPAYTHFAHQEKIGVLSSRSNRAKTLMSKAFGQRWHGMPYEETELYKELEEADKERYEKEACAQDTAASLS